MPEHRTVKNTVHNTSEPPYRAFLVRCWCDGDPVSSNAWRFAVVEIDQDQRHGFVTLEDLVSFLQAQLYGEKSQDKQIIRTDHPDKDK